MHAWLPTQRSRRLLLASAGAVFLAGASALVVSGLGVFNDDEAVADNSLDAGTIDLSTSPVSSLLSLTSMFPGDALAAQLLVTNAGDGELRYAMSASVSEGVLSAGLSLTIKSGLTTCDITSMDDALLGTVVVDATLASAGFGNPAQGLDAGDRTLAAGSSEALCFLVRLPLSADNSLQGLSTSATFAFSAEQTKNNP